MIAQNPRGAATALTRAAMAFCAAVAPAQSAGTAAAVATKSVVVEMNEGRLIKLSSSASSVFIANPDIADVSVKSPRLVYVFGVTPGETTLYAVDRSDRMIASLKIQVEHNLSGLNGALKRLVQSGQITATSIDGGVILTGVVSDSVDVENARRVCRDHVRVGTQVGGHPGRRQALVVDGRPHVGRCFETGLDARLGNVERMGGG